MYRQKMDNYKLMKYKIEIVETLSKIREIEANTSQEAIEKANDMYFNNEIRSLTTKDDSNEDIKFQDVTDQEDDNY